MRSDGRAGFARVLAATAALCAMALTIAPAMASDVPTSISTQQTFNGKTYGFCFSGISAKAGNNPVKTINGSCTGSFQTSTSVPSDAPLIITFFGPITVTCPNGKIAATKLGSVGALYSLFLIPGASQTSTSISVTSPCGDNNKFSLSMSAWSPMGAWVFYVTP